MGGWDPTKQGCFCPDSLGSLDYTSRFTRFGEIQSQASWFDKLQYFGNWSLLQIKFSWTWTSKLLHNLFIFLEALKIYIFFFIVSWHLIYEEKNSLVTNKCFFALTGKVLSSRASEYFLLLKTLVWKKLYNGGKIYIHLLYYIISILHLEVGIGACLNCFEY